MRNKVEGEPRQSEEVPIEDVVSELRKKAAVLQQRSDNQRTQRAEEELEKGRPLEHVFDIYFDRR